MKYKFKLTNTTGVVYVPNGYLGHLKMFVGDEQAVQQGYYTNLNGNYKVSFNFKVQDKIYQVIVETLTYWSGKPLEQYSKETVTLTGCLARQILNKFGFQ